jgi:hypothetical protein
LSSNDFILQRRRDMMGDRLFELTANFDEIGQSFITRKESDLGVFFRPRPLALNDELKRL